MNSRSIRAAISAAVHDTDPEIVDARKECSISFDYEIRFQIFSNSILSHPLTLLIFISRQKLLITGFCFDDSTIGAAVYDTNVKNALTDITAISKKLPNLTDDQVISLT